MRGVQAAGEPPLTEQDGDDAGGGPPEVPPRGRRFLLLLATAVVWYALDQVSKALIVAHYGDGHVTTLIPHVLQIEESRNAGAAFGIGTGATVVFAVVAVVVIVLIVRTARRLRSRAWALALGLLLGGAAGNLTDRIARSPGVFRGRVVDWIYLHHWPVFNLADAGIVVGGILAVLLAARGLSPDGTRSRD